MGEQTATIRIIDRATPVIRQLNERLDRVNALQDAIAVELAAISELLSKSFQGTLEIIESPLDVEEAAYKVAKHLNRRRHQDTPPEDE